MERNEKNFNNVIIHIYIYIFNLLIYNKYNDILYFNVLD
jgi:hypothetical protein